MKLFKSFLLLIFLSLSLFSADFEFAKNYNYIQNYEEAKVAALKQNKPLFVLFVTKTCPWCKKLENQVLTKSDINKAIHKNFIPVLLDKESDKFPSFLDPKVVPTTYLVNTSKDYSFGEIVGYKKRDDFMELVNEGLKRYRSVK